MNIKGLFVLSFVAFSAMLILQCDIAFSAGGADSVELSYTTAVTTACATNGTLYGIHIASGVAGAETHCWDRLDVGGLISSSTGTIWTVAIGTSSGVNNSYGLVGDDRPPSPIKVNRSLTCINSATSHRSNIIVSCP